MITIQIEMVLDTFEGILNNLTKSQHTMCVYHY